MAYSKRLMDSLAKLIKFAQCNKHVQESLDIIEKVILKYKPENTCLSFNGGKDCTAILHLVHSSVKKLFPDDDGYKILAFYAQLPNHFDEESEFVKQTVTRYNLKLMQYSSSSLKESLCQFKADAPHVEAIFVGTRNDDLKRGAKIDVLAPTDQDWPKFMRINPLLNWSYSQVWDFIKQLDIPYCDLYNQGYTSLGTKNDTAKNSSLLRFNEDNVPYYLPAWNLKKTDEERISRSSSLEVTKIVTK